MLLKKKIQFSEWDAGAGHIDNKKRCGLLSFNGYLSNVECTESKPYICEQFKGESYRCTIFCISYVGVSKL